MCRIEVASPESTETLNRFIDIQDYTACKQLKAEGIKFCWDGPLPPCWDDEGNFINQQTKKAWIMKAKLLGLL